MKTYPKTGTAYKESALALSRMRARVYTWGPREAQADRVLRYLKQRKMRNGEFLSKNNARGDSYARAMWM